MRRMLLIAAGLTLGLSILSLPHCGPADSSQLDYDNDGTPDEQDAFPIDADEQKDTDLDGVGDNADAFPGSPSETLDTDRDGVGNNTDSDDDDDGIPDVADPNPTDVPDPDEPAPTDPFGGQPGDPIPTLTGQQTISFQTGRAIFERQFAPAEGLRVGAVVQSCNGCHSDPVTGGNGIPRAFQYRAALSTTYFPVLRKAPALFGAGLLGSVTDAEILSRQDLNDADGDGISGRANVDGVRVGRFGVKAQSATIEGITREMLMDQLGITSVALTVRTSLAPLEKREGFFTNVLNALASISFVTPAHAQIIPPTPDTDPTQDDDVPDPELASTDLQMLVTFAGGLATPLRDSVSESVQRGEQTFMEIGCAKCHLPTLMTESGQEIHPYSDLLLHDMGFENYDGVVRSLALATEFRTAPLWGLHRETNFWHDGSRITIEQAIAAHGGEAIASRDAFAVLPASERQDLLSFLNSL